MFSLAPDFWPLFWAITGGAALVTVLLSLLVATFSPEWFRRHHPHQPGVTPAGVAGRRHGHDHHAQAA
jgi:hypothetical protein